jgi:MAP kinase interacting serine/threonine kinase
VTGELLSPEEFLTMTIKICDEEKQEFVEESFETRQKEAQKRRKKKKKSDRTLVASNFVDLYKLTGETLGEGSYGKVETCVNIYTGLEYAVKIIEKRPGFYSRSKVLKEIEIYHLCRGQQNIIQLIEFFEESERFCLVFEKIHGGPLLDHIQARICFTEAEASNIISDLAQAIKYLHNKGIAHRDLKPDNVLCVNANCPSPVKLCDFDLCSEASIDISTPTLLTPVGSVEYMAPEVVDTFLIDYYDDDDDESLCYNKKCDLWSLGVIMYILLCGYAPFSGHCGSDCGWDRGESCTDCQERLFSSIKEGRLVFPDKHWAAISPQAKDLIVGLLVKDSKVRLDSEQVLCHPWIVNGGSSHNLETPQNLRRQTSIKDLEDFASRAMAVNRAVEDEAEKMVTVTFPIRIPLKSETWSSDSSPPSFSSLSPVCDIVSKRRRSRVNFWDKMNKFCSIDELDLESDFFSKAIV